MKKTFPIGLIVIFMITVLLFYTFPKFMIYFLMGACVVTAIYVGWAIKHSEEMPEKYDDCDESFDIFRQKDKENES